MSLLLDYFKKSQARQKNLPLFSHPDVEIHKQNRSCGDDCRVKLRFSRSFSAASTQAPSSTVCSQSDDTQPSLQADGGECGTAKISLAKISLGKLASDLQIEASGCAVHLASSEIALEFCQNLNQADATQLIVAFMTYIENRQEPNQTRSEHLSILEAESHAEILGLLADPRIQALFKLRDHPVRKKCVLLGWQTLCEALGRWEH